MGLTYDNTSTYYDNTSPDYGNYQFISLQEIIDSFKAAYVGEGKICDGSYVNNGRRNSIRDCGSFCNGNASMFIFGTNDFGGNACNKTECQCYCASEATIQGTCDTTENNQRIFGHIEHIENRTYKIKDGI